MIDTYVTQNTVLYARPDFKSNKVGYPEKEDKVEVFYDNDPVSNFILAEWSNKTGYLEKRLIDKYVPVFEEDDYFIPNDQEIYDAWGAHRPSQYINIKAKFPKAKSLNYNLCGQFAVAQFLQMNVMDFLVKWASEVKNAERKLIWDDTTGNPEIQTMLTLNGFPMSKIVQVDNLTAATLTANLPCIAGVGIDKQGRIEMAWPGVMQRLFGGFTRHWVTVYQVQPVLGTAWVLVYNSFWNRMETVPMWKLTDNKFTMITAQA